MSLVRRVLFVLLGPGIGGFVGFWVITAIREFIFPMFGWTDEMSVGIGEGPAQGRTVDNFR